MACRITVGGFTRWYVFVFIISYLIEKFDQKTPKILDGVPYNGSRNGSSMFINPNATLFFQDGLDETTSHTVNITNVFGDIILTITSFTVFATNDIHTEVQPTNTSPNSATTSIPALYVGIEFTLHSDGARVDK